MVWTDYLPKKSLVLVVVVSGGWQTKLCVSPGPGLCSLVLEVFGPDLGPDLDLTWLLGPGPGPELDNLDTLAFKPFPAFLHDSENVLKFIFESWENSQKGRPSPTQVENSHFFSERFPNDKHQEIITNRIDGV